MREPPLFTVVVPAEVPKAPLAVMTSWPSFTVASPDQAVEVPAGSSELSLLMVAKPTPFLIKSPGPEMLPLKFTAPKPSTVMKVPEGKRVLEVSTVPLMQRVE